MINLAGGIIKDKKSRILLLHRNTPTLVQWELPGGKIETEEIASEAAIRELKEELDVDVQIKNYIGKAFFSDSKNDYCYYWFDCEIISGIPIIVEEKFDNLQFFSMEELLEMKELLSPNMLNLLPNLYR